MDPLAAGLLIANAELLDEVHACFRGLPVRVRVEQNELGDLDSFLENLRRARPDVVVVELAGTAARVEETLRALKQAPGAPDVIAVQAAVDPEAIVAAMRAGASEYLYPPLDPRLKQALERISGSRAGQGAPARPGGKTLAFFSAKGGCGATSVACHVAVELQRQTEQQILLADLDIDAGMIRFLLKTKSQYSVLDAATNVHRLDVNFWRALVSNGMPRLEIIAAPEASAAPAPDEESVRQVLRFARSQYDCVIADLGRSINSLSMGVLDEIDESYVVTTVDVPALYQAKQILQKLLEAGYGANRLHVILNRTPRRTEVTVEEIERMLGAKVYAILPDEHTELYEAYAGGTLVPPTSALGKHFGRLAAKIAGIAPAPGGGKRRFSLF
ncbi:MAG: AAA family ATPase [Acidobacteriota bacterium]